MFLLMWGWGMGDECTEYIPYVCPVDDRSSSVADDEWINDEMKYGDTEIPQRAIQYDYCARHGQTRSLVSVCMYCTYSSM